MGADQDYDAIVVGSGISGGWAAKELTERGLRVLMLDRGRPIEHGKDYTGEHKAPWEFKFRGRGDRKLVEEHYPYAGYSVGVNLSDCGKRCPEVNSDNFTHDKFLLKFFYLD